MSLKLKDKNEIFTTRSNVDEDLKRLKINFHLEQLALIQSERVQCLRRSTVLNNSQNINELLHITTPAPY